MPGNSACGNNIPRHYIIAIAAGRHEPAPMGHAALRHRRGPGRLLHGRAGPSGRAASGPSGPARPAGRHRAGLARRLPIRAIPGLTPRALHGGRALAAGPPPGRRRRGFPRVRAGDSRAVGCQPSPCSRHAADRRAYPAAGPEGARHPLRRPCPRGRRARRGRAGHDAREGDPGRPREPRWQRPRRPGDSRRTTVWCPSMAVSNRLERELLGTRPGARRAVRKRLEAR